jgi:predicted Zn-ribbon and HTH transcriptional regulator
MFFALQRVINKTVKKNNRSIKMENKICFNCGKTDEQIPVLEMQYKKNQLWVCPQCIPNLIHNPDVVQDKLQEAEKKVNV